MFSDELKNISWQETTERIASMTDADVRRALGKSRCDVNDFMAIACSRTLLRADGPTLA